MKNQQQNLAATAEVTCGTDKNKMRTVSKLKRGWNWEYSFGGKTLPDGTRRTLVVEYQLHHRASGTDVIISNYPGGRPYEDAAVEEIGDAFRDFVCTAREDGVAWREVRERRYLTAWLIDAPIDSEIVKAFAAALAAINRVAVEIKMTEEAQ